MALASRHWERRLICVARAQWRKLSSVSQESAHGVTGLSTKEELRITKEELRRAKEELRTTKDELRITKKN